MSVLRQLLFLGFNLRRSSLVYVWFADYHSFFPLLLCKFLNKKSVLIIGGYDAARLPEYRYGAHINVFRSWVVGQNCKYASKILAVSSFVLKNLVQNTHLAHSLKTHIIYNGADTNSFQPNYLVSKDGVICVSGANTEKRIKIKGLDFFADVAAAMPSISFTVVGVTGRAREILEERRLANLKIIEWLNKEELKEMLIRSKVICQFSRYESFGLALAEGMLCGCIPVTVKNTGPEEIISEEVGIAIPALDVERAKDAISRALSFSRDVENKARLRVMSYFSLRKRQESILKVLNELENTVK